MAAETHSARYPVVDAHVHVWDPERLRYPWLDGILALDRPFLPADIDRGNGSPIRHVFVQAGCSPQHALDEVRWVLGMRDAWPELAAIVADADLRSGPALETHLDALDALAGPGACGTTDVHDATAASNPRPAGAVPDGAGLPAVRVAGIRHLLQDEPEELLAHAESRSALVDGLRLLAERGLTFDVCVRHWQLDTVVDLLESVPELSVVLDHLGKPPIEDGIDSADGRAWVRSIDRLARIPLAHVKVSGLAAEASTSHALNVHAEPFLTHALNAFGPERSMLGSDWPVSALTGAGGTFEAWRERVRRAASGAGFDEDALAAIEHGTAERFYGLPSATPQRRA